MKNFAVIFLLLIFSLTAFAQKPKPAKKPTPTKTTKTVVKLGNEKEEFEKAVAIADSNERIAALLKFAENFPNSTEKNRALELVVSARAAIGDEKLRLSDTQSGIELFKLAVTDAPIPMSDKLFSEIILQFPTNLFFRGQQTAALEIANLIEQKSAGSAKQLLALSTFYIGTENADEAKRLAEKAIALEPNFPAAFQTLGLAYRVNFQLEESANAYAKALELDQESLVSRRSLAEMKRATGKPNDAATLYREVLAKDSADVLAQTGLTLALFDADKRAEAEAEMNRSLETNPNNLMLLVGAAYWYAAHNEGVKAIELAEKAVALEPRYTWAHIALARGYLQQKRPVEAERALLIARQYGNFPTLDYEIASARMQAGFFREAAEELKKNFSVKGETVETKLGGRVLKQSDNFTELLSLERRASIFQMTAADNPENAAHLKALLNFNQKLEAEQSTDEEIAQTADEFIKGDDKMKFHRQLFAATILLQKSKALPKVFEIAQSAVGKSDDSLNVPNPSAAVLAEELYETRSLAISQNQLLNVPQVPRQTLSAILRGRIEEIAGWSLYRQNKTADAIVRLKRAVSVLPDKSAWWRSSWWRLGIALQADGKDSEALAAYIKSYPTDTPNALKYSIIEELYKKTNGNTDGLEAKIGVKPISSFSETIAQNTEVKTETKVSDTAEKPIEKPQPTPAIPETTPTPEAKPASEINSNPIPENVPLGEPLKVEKVAETKIESNPEPTSVPTIVPTPEIVSETKIKNTPTPTPEIKSEIQPTTENPVETIVQNSANPAATEVSVAENKSETPKSSEVQQPKEENANNSNTTKPLFEPIIITVPKQNIKPEKTETQPSETPKVEGIENVDVKPETAAVKENTEKPIEIVEEPKVENTSNETLVSDISRKRIADPKRIQFIQPCTLVVSQENISLLNGGGSLGIVVSFEKGGDLKELTVSSGSPDDIEITYEPEIGALTNRAFFIVKSISSNVGDYKITFESPCAKKEIPVKVR